MSNGADLIVIGSVTRLVKVKGIQVAEVQVASTLKGPSYPSVYYLAQPTWTCDITSGTVGEDALFFFNKYAFDPEPTSMAFVRPAGRAGVYTVENGDVPLGAFKEPLGFREEIKTLVGTSSFFWQVSWSGRGQMPIREVRASKYVTLWVGDVVLPAAIPTFNGPKREYGFIRSALLSTVIDFVQHQVQNGLRQSRAVPNPSPN